MESFKKFSDYPCTPCTILSEESLAKYDDYIKKACEQSRKMELTAREWARNNIIWFHSGR